MFKSVASKDSLFFDLFDQICANIVEGAQMIIKVIETGQGCGEQAQDLKTVEHKTDQLVHQLMSHLHRTFITPIDREDIHQLAVRLDDILDQAEAAGSRIAGFCPVSVPPRGQEPRHRASRERQARQGDGRRIEES